LYDNDFNVIGFGTFNNQGSLIIGGTTAVGGGLFNAGAFTNHADGTISIDRCSSVALYDFGESFDNYGDITIGAVDNSGSTGLYFFYDFINHAGGSIAIDRTTFAGILSDGGTLTNDGDITIGAKAGVGRYGIYNAGIFDNNIGSSLSIDRSNLAGIFNTPSPNFLTPATFNNASEINVGATTVGGYGIENVSASTINNSSCATIYIEKPLKNEATFDNAGRFWVNTIEAHTNSGTLTNEGVIEYPQGNPIPNVINNEIIIAPISGSCDLFPVLSLGEVVDFTIGTNWFSDVNLTQVAGTYNSVDNTFTVSNLPDGAHTPYFDVTDNANNCVRTLSINVNYFNDVTPPFPSCPGLITAISDTYDCSAEVSYSITAADDCGIASIDYSIPSGSVFERGTTLVTAQAFDAVGNSATCTFWVYVEEAAEVCDGEDNDCDGLVDELEHLEQTYKSFDAEGGEFENYGSAVTISGRLAAAGIHKDGENGTNSGAVLLYQKSNNGSWQVIDRLHPDDPTMDAQFGYSVFMKGSLLFVGAPFHTDNFIKSGAVYVFAKNVATNEWEQVGKILPNDPSDNQQFGVSLSYDGRFLVAGALLDDQTAQDAGAAYLFDGQNSWGQTAKLRASDGTTGDEFGTSVSITNLNWVAVGAPKNDEYGLDAGAVYLYRRSGTTWIQHKKLKGSTTIAGDWFGSTVALSGTTLLAGAPQNDERAIDAGMVYAFDQNVGGVNQWNQRTKLFAYDGEKRDRFGSSLGFEGNNAIVGAPFDNPQGANSGSGYVFFRLNDGQWIFIEKAVDPTGNLNDKLFSSVALSGRSIIAGAPTDDNNMAPLDRGSVQWYETEACVDGDPDFDVVSPQPISPDAASVQLLTDEVNMRSWPSPFNAQLNIEVVVPEPVTNASITLVNMLGQEVAVIYSGPIESRKQQFDWTPQEPLAAGIYTLKLNTGTTIKSVSVMKVTE
jgi:hypothetical protein